MPVPTCLGQAASHRLCETSVWIDQLHWADKFPTAPHSRSHSYPCFLFSILLILNSKLQSARFVRVHWVLLPFDPAHSISVHQIWRYVNSGVIHCRNVPPASLPQSVYLSNVFLLCGLDMISLNLECKHVATRGLCCLYFHIPACHTSKTFILHGELAWTTNNVEFITGRGEALFHFLFLSELSVFLYDSMIWLFAHGQLQPFSVSFSFWYDLSDAHRFTHCDYCPN